MLVNYTADDKGYEKLPETLKLLADQLPQGNGEKYAFTHPVKNLNEGLRNLCTGVRLWHAAETSRDAQTAVYRSIKDPAGDLKL